MNEPTQENIAALLKTGPKSTREIAQYFNTPKAWMTGRLLRVERKGLIKRLSNPEGGKLSPGSTWTNL